MTIGIYCLKFNGTDKVYIGQSVNIERRYRQHKQTMRAYEASEKLQEAFNKYGDPILSIVLICKEANLDLYEELIIKLHDSSNTGFNSYSRANEAPVLKGTDHGACIYTKEQLITVFNILYNCPDISYQDIENFTKVRAHTISNIANGIQHIWLHEDMPEKAVSICNNKGTRTRARTYVSDKLSAKSKGIIYPNILSPNGIVYSIDNAYKFAKEHNLAGNHLQEVLNGHRKSHKGWKLCQ